MENNPTLMHSLTKHPEWPFFTVANKDPFISKDCIVIAVNRILISPMMCMWDHYLFICNSFGIMDKHILHNIIKALGQEIPSFRCPGDPLRQPLMGLQLFISSLHQNIATSQQFLILVIIIWPYKTKYWRYIIFNLNGKHILIID